MERRPALVRVLWASVAWDLGALVLLLAMPAWLLDVFDHPRPADTFLFRLAALPLLMAPVVYAMAARDGRPASPLASATVGLRTVGAAGIVLLLLWERPAGAAAYWLFAIADLGWAAAVAALRR